MNYIKLYLPLYFVYPQTLAATPCLDFRLVYY